MVIFVIAGVAVRLPVMASARAVAVLAIGQADRVVLLTALILILALLGSRKILSGCTNSKKVHLLLCSVFGLHYLCNYK